MTTTESLGEKLAKRMPRVLIPYIGGSWGAVQFVEWTTNRYLLSPFLVDLTVYIAVLLLPTAVLLAYFRGEHGRTPWTRAEKLGIPLNLIFAATLLSVIFHSKDLGAVTKQVEVKNANGQTVERQVPKSSFRKHVALFFFENRSGDAQLDWLGQGIPALLEIDLTQDLFVTTKTQYTFVEAIKKAAQSPTDALPLALKQELARNSHLDFIVYGSISKQSSDYVVEVSLASTSKGKPIAERIQRGPDPFKLVDELSIQLRKDLGIPSTHVDDSPDLPVSEISTHSIEALRTFILGWNEWLLRNSARAGIAWLEQSVKADPGYAFAWLALAQALFDDNQQRKMEAALASAKRNEYRFSERTRFQLESMVAIFNKDPEKELAILRQWVTLYPDDDQAHQELANSYLRRNRLDEAAGEYRLLHEMDPENPNYLIQSGQVSEGKGDYQAALQHYLDYQQKAPSDPQGYLKAGSVYSILARYAEAKASFAKVLAFAPDQVEALARISGVERRMGHFDLAKEAIERALKQSPSPTDLVAILAQQTELFGLQGQWKQSLLSVRKAWDIKRANESITDFLRFQLNQMEPLVEAGQTEEALQIIANAEQTSDNVNVLFSVQMAFADVYVLSRDPARAAAAVAQVEKLVKTYDIGAVQPWLYYYHGHIDELNGSYASAIARYQDFLHTVPSPQVLVDMARCHRQLKQFKPAHEALARALEAYPAYPQAHDELARLFLDEGDRAKARDEVAAALKIWAQADPGYKAAADARQLAAELAH